MISAVILKKQKGFSWEKRTLSAVISTGGRNPAPRLRSGNGLFRWLSEVGTKEKFVIDS